MPSAVLIISNPTDAFAAYMAISDVCEVHAVPGLVEALGIDTDIQVIFIEAKLLANEMTRALADKFPTNTTKWVVLVPPEKPVLNAKHIPLNSVIVECAPLTSAVGRRYFEDDVYKHLPNPTAAHAAKAWT